MTFLEILQSYCADHGRVISSTVGRQFRGDANETLAMAKQLEYVYSRNYNATFPSLKARTLIPVNTEGGDSETFLYRGYQPVGTPKWLKDTATDFPNIGMIGAEQAGKYATFGASYEFSDDQLGRAAFMGLPLDTALATAAREACDRFLDNVAVIGGPGLKGLATDTSVGVITKASAAAAGLATYGDWDTSTGSEIIADIDFATGQMFIGSDGAVEAGALSLVLPLKAYQALRDKRVDNTNDQRNLLEFLVSSGRIGDISSWSQLNAVAGATGNAERAVLYQRDPDVLELLVPKDFVQSEPQRTGFNTKVFCKVKTGGVDIHRPDRVRYLDEIQT